MRNKFIICTMMLVLSSLGIMAQANEITISGSFNEIKIYDKIQAELIKADVNKVVAEGIDKDEITAEVNDGTLKIKLSLNNVWSETNTKVKIYYTTAEIIDANEGAYAELQGEIEQDKLVLKVQEGAQISGNIAVNQLQVKAVTGGVIAVRGSAQEQVVLVKTGGSYEGKHLTTQQTEVSIVTGGNAEVYATNYCKAKTTAGGDIDIYGNPKKVDKKTSLGGNISKRDE